MEGGRPRSRLRRPYDEVFDHFRTTSTTTWTTKPEAHRQWRWDQQHGLWGFIDPSDTKPGCDISTTTCSFTVSPTRASAPCSGARASGAGDDTAVIFTSDHGDMCGSHGLRSKGPFVYEEIMRVPLYVRVPGVTRPGAQTDALGTHVDLAATICRSGGIDPATAAGRCRLGRGRSRRRSSPIRKPMSATTSCSRRTRLRRRTDERHALRVARLLRRHARSTPVTTASVAASRRRGCGARTRDISLRRRQPLRRPGPRVVRPRRRPPRAGQPGA